MSCNGCSCGLCIHVVLIGLRAFSLVILVFFFNINKHYAICITVANLRWVSPLQHFIESHSCICSSEDPGNFRDITGFNVEVAQVFRPQFNNVFVYDMPVLSGCCVVIEFSY